MKEPILTKRPPHRWDNVEMTWEKFIKLREWARKVANEFGFPVYLVGSTLYKTVPRDFDVSIVMPSDEYERRYGKFPDDPKEQNDYMNMVWGHGNNVRYYFEGREALGETVSFDLKICADSWFIEKDKLLLASPKVIEDGKQA